MKKVQVYEFVKIHEIKFLLLLLYCKTKSLNCKCVCYRNFYATLFLATKTSPPVTMSNKLSGEYIGNIDQGGAADLCGLMEDDLVLAVNGKALIGMDHTDAVNLVKSVPNNVVFLVVGPTAKEYVSRSDVDSFYIIFCIKKAK